MNEFVEYYSKHKISPVSQDISNLEKHIWRRLRLYQLLGINAKSFKDAKILEVGAGSGYNTLALLLLDDFKGKVDIVEPNKTGIEAMQKLFLDHNISSSCYKIYPCFIEEFKSTEEYDFILAEGFLPSFCAENRQKILKALLNNLSSKSVLVTTCICEFSYFFEYLRILLGLYLVRDVESFDAKISLLCDAYASHLEALEFASRPIKDWVSDSILNPVCDHMSFSLETSIEEVESFLGNIEVLGMSPNMFVNLSWYKDTSYSYAKVIKESFNTKRHLLLCHYFEDSYRDERLNKDLLSEIISLKALVKEFRKSLDEAIFPKIALLLGRIIKEHKDLGDFFIDALRDCVYLLENPCFIQSHNIASLPNFSKAWGRGQQYISFRRVV